MPRQQRQAFRAGTGRKSGAGAGNWGTVHDRAEEPHTIHPNDPLYDEDAPPAPCRFFTRSGRCRFGSKCRYAHMGAPAGTNATHARRCKFFARGKCDAGSSCRFEHTSAARDDPLAGVGGQLEGLSLDNNTTHSGEPAAARSGEPAPSRLLVLDVNGLLLYRAQMNEQPDARFGPPATTLARRAVYIRPGVQEFVEVCTSNFVVVVWSSAKLKNFTKLLSLVFGVDWEQRVAMVWGQEHCTDTGLKHPENAYKPVFLKELSKLWKSRELSRFGQFGAHNTLLVDDSVYKTALNPMFTAIHPPEWTPLAADNNELDDIGKLLKQLAEETDIPAFLKSSGSHAQHIRDEAQCHREFVAHGLIQYQERHTNRTHAKSKHASKQGGQAPAHAR